MKTNLPGEFEVLAQAAIDDEATDAQLEALESAIMESPNGADVLRDQAMRQAVAAEHVAAASVASAAAAVETQKWSLMFKVAVFGSVAAAAAVVTLLGAGVLFFQMTKAQQHQAQLAQVETAPEVATTVDGGEFAAEMPPLVTDTVPEPSTSLLLFSGMSILLLRRRR